MKASARTSIICTLIIVSIPLLAACDTNVRLLELQKAQLQQVDEAETSLSQEASSGKFGVQKYDLYLFLNATIFDQLLTPFDNTKLEVGEGHPIDITLNSVRMKFHPGSPLVSVDARAVDRKSGIEAAVILDAKLVVVGDNTRPDSLKIKLIATKIVPKIHWGPLQIEKWLFARRLLELEATKLTDRVPEISLPVTSDFIVGSKPTTQTATFATGNGSSVTGTLSIPGTQLHGNVHVKSVLFLKNGLHVFADVEGIQ